MRQVIGAMGVVVLLGGCSSMDEGGAAGGYYFPEAADAEAADAGDRYEAVGTNPYVMTAHDPLSTFAADVDTASYDIFRRDVMSGRLPDPASVRLEEYVNYFEYTYAPPEPLAEHPFAIGLTLAPSVLPRETSLLRVGIQARLPAAVERRAANLVFLIDTSGSMTGPDRLPLVQYTLTEALDVLAPTDTVAVVTYAGSTAVRLPPTPVSERAEIERVIAGLSSGGSTAGAAGLDLAYAQAEAGFIEGGINHVMLCTDGDFNVGPSSTEALVSAIEEKRETGITFTVLGYGEGNLNDAMMEAISNKGNGVYGVIIDEDSATKYVVERLLSTMDFVAKDLKIQVEFNPEHVLAYRLLGYENRAIADDDFRDDLVDAGEVGAGHRVTALYELIPAGGTLPVVTGAPAATDGPAFDGAPAVGAEDLVLVKVRYKQIDAVATDPALEVAAGLPPTALAATFADADGDFQWATAVAALAEILKQSPYAQPAALDRIEEILTRPELLTDADREELSQLFLRAKPLLPTGG